jgi:hypothetical protein
MDMTDTRQSTLATAVNTTGEEQAANARAIVWHRHPMRHRDPVAVVRPIERSRKMITEETAHRDLEAVENLLTTLADGRGELTPLAALTRAQEEAAIEAQDVLMQADEALVMG